MEKKNREGKGEWNFERGNIFFAEEKVKEGKNIFFWRRREMKKEDGEIIWRRKMLPWRDNEQRNKER